MSTGDEGGDGLGRIRQAAARARLDLLTRLQAEADRIDRELAEGSQRAADEARAEAERRIERGLARLEQASAELSAELARQLQQGSQRFRELLEEQLEAHAAELQAQTRSEVEALRVYVDRRLEESAAAQRRSDAERRRIRPLPRDGADRARLEALVERLRAADGRLRAADARTRRALGRQGTG